jgi:hypothetical protein
MLVISAINTNKIEQNPGPGFAGIVFDIMMLFFLFKDLDELRKQIEEELRQQVKFNLFGSYQPHSYN